MASKSLLTGRVLFALGAGVSTVPALANDSTAQLGAGGLELIRNEVIRLLSEDLYVSADEVRVRYRFENISKAAARYLIAFPLPALDAKVPEEMNIVLPNSASENFVNFAVTVDGAPVPVELYERATAFGIDHSDTLRALGLSLNPIADGAWEAVEAQSPSTIAELNRLGLVIDDPYATMPAWRYEAIFHWDQTFPAGREITVEHRYQPVTGYSLFGEWALEDPYYIEHYCMDEPFIRAARNRLQAIAGSPNPYLEEVRLEYILTTANNWATPIGEFRLVVDKGSTEALVSFCGSGITRIGPTQFEITAENYYAGEELEVLIIRPSRQN